MHYQVKAAAPSPGPSGTEWLPKIRVQEVAAARAEARSVAEQEEFMTADHFKDLFNCVLSAVIDIPGAVDAINRKVAVHEYRRK